MNPLLKNLLIYLIILWCIRYLCQRKHVSWTSIYIHFGNYCTFLSMHMHFILPRLTNAYVYFKIGGQNLVFKMWILYRTEFKK